MKMGKYYGRDLKSYPWCNPADDLGFLYMSLNILFCRQKGNIVPRSNRYLNNATDDITMDEYPTTNTRSSYSNGNSYS